MSVKIRVKNGKLQLDIHYGEGRRTRPSTGLEDTDENRKLLLNEIIPDIKREIAKGTYVPKAERIETVSTVKDYGLISFSRHANERKPHVQKSYKNHFMNHIVPKFGKRLIASIKPMQLLDWQNTLLKERKASTVKRYRSIFHTIFDDAVTEGIIDINPFMRVPLPQEAKPAYFDDEIDEEDKNVNPFTLDEIYHLIDKSKDDKKNFIGIMAFSGVRPGELAGLKWKDVDWENETFQIKRTRTRGTFSTPKTISSRRTVEMLPAVKSFLLNQYQRTANNEYDMVFLTRFNKPYYSHDVIAKQFKDLLDEDDSRYLYQLRHSFATLMISEGEDILWVSRIMGHKNANITLQIYAKAYKVIQDKKQRKQRATFLDDWHKSVTINNTKYEKAQEIGVQR